MAPEWVGAPRGARLYALSGCVSAYFTDYIPHWQHNGFWLFNSPSILDQVAVADGLLPEDFDLLYFEVEPLEYHEQSADWRRFGPDPSFTTNVEPPERAVLLGYDIVCFSCGTSPECSPVTCCGLASQLPVNESTLLPSAEAAHRALESGMCNDSEPGPFRVFSVHLVREATASAA